MNKEETNLLSMIAGKCDKLSGMGNTGEKGAVKYFS